MAEETKNQTTGGAEKDQNQQGSKGTENQDASKDEGKVILTKEELDKRLQTEADKRVSEAEKTWRKKHEAELKDKIEKERRDAERLAQLSAEEKEKELFERNKQALAEKEKLLSNREMKLAAIDVLSEEGLPVTFADQLLGESVEDTHERIKAFKKAWHEAVETEVNKQLKNYTPDHGGSKKEEINMNQILRNGFRKKG